MSIRENGVQFDPPNVKRGFALFALVAVLELVFSFFLVLSLAQRILAPHKAGAAPGVPQLLSYQGRLTDTAGNPLGGTGTTYCFRYSLYDAQAGGGQLWPAGTPSTSTSTVIDGVFSDQVGRADVLNYDFVSTSTVYLQVDVNTVTSTCSGTWESLVPRQQLTSSAYSQSSENIYGNAIRTPTSTKVQIGTGAGVALGQTLFSLDVVNAPESIGGTCNNNNGTFWYNSTLGRALVCENNTINVLSNSSTTIAGIGTNASTPITGGTVVFSNSNGVTFGQNGSTITASMNAGGGATLSRWDVVPAGQISSSQQTQSSATIREFILPQAISFSRIDVPIQVSLASSSVANTANLLISSGIVIYSRNVSTLQPISGSFGTTTLTWASNTSNFSNLTGGRLVSFALGGTLAPGEYWVGFQLSTNNNSSIGTATTQLGNTISILFGSTYTASKYNNFGTTMSASSNISFHGLYSTTITATNQTIPMSGVTVSGTAGARANVPIVFRNW